MIPETRYARSGNFNIAYQVLGEGPLDLVVVMGWVTHIELNWEEPSIARFLRRLASFSRLIAFDKRGTGLSDRVSPGELPILEQRMDDVRAVMDAAGSRRAAIFGYSDGGPLAALFAATYPERTSALVLYGTFSRGGAHLVSPEVFEQYVSEVESRWPASIDLGIVAPSADEKYRAWFPIYLRYSASPGAAAAMMRMNGQIDVRNVLSAIRVPTLVLCRTHARFGHGAAAWFGEEGAIGAPARAAHEIAERIPGAKIVELPGVDHLPWAGDADALVDEMEEFLTGVRHGVEPDRMLATILFTDIVESTELAARSGDRAWRDLLERHHALVRRQLERFRGREIDVAGDGFLAAFDGPARAIRCAWSIAEAVTGLGLRVRAGLHTGECEVIGDKLAGIAVHTAARVAAQALPGEVLVSSTVRDLVAGSSLQFQDRGSHTLKGVPGEWRLFRVQRDGDRIDR